MEQSDYYFGKRVEGEFDQVLFRAQEALKEQGFGVLTEIDVKAKLKEKLDVDFRPYQILGACNPKLAHQALNQEVNLGVLLPCNVIVYRDEEDRIAVMAMDPVRALGVVNNPGMEEIALQVRSALEKALQNI